MKVSTGFFTVETGTAVIDVKLRIFVDNLENNPASATVVVSKLVEGEVMTVLVRNVTVPGGERAMIEVDNVEGQDFQVTMTLPERPYPPQSPLVPGVAVVSIFPPNNNETTLLHWISADDFAVVNGPATPAMSARAVRL